MCGEGKKKKYIYIYKRSFAPIVECLVNYRNDCYSCA